MTPRNVESRPSRATGTPGTYWSAGTEQAARKALKAAQRADQRAERQRARALKFAADVRRERARAERLAARIGALEAQIRTLRDGLDRLQYAAADDVRTLEDEALGAERLRAATKEMFTIRPAGRHPERATR